MEPGYWRDRLFRNTFTYKGHLCLINHWSVKIQHLGTRKTFSLQAIAIAEAAAEACQLYKAIITRGWESVFASGKGRDLESRPPPSALAAPETTGFGTSYWTPRLIHRKYTEAFRPTADRELSVRIDHAGASHYFPLGTGDARPAANRAARIYQTIVRKGWATAGETFPRELSLAFRWVDQPVVWTYTTVHTHTGNRRLPQALPSGRQIARLNVAITESDAGLRRVLAWCINQQEGCSCVAAFANAAAALREIPRRPIHLLLVGQDLADQSGTDCLNELKIVAPEVTGVLFSVYEDSEQLFKSTPGGAGTYMFRRTPPTGILAPITAAWKKGVFTREEIAKSVRDYFEQAVVSLRIDGYAHELVNLTPREHEILDLLSKGHPDKEMAEILRISTWTVHGHLKKIFEKLGAHNRTDAVVKYLHK
jgi:DNA-binding NarL/FixJ family response regulator